MRKKTIVLAGVSVAAVAAIAGTGVAYAVTDGFTDSDELSGSALERATAAAVPRVEGGSVTGAEKDDDGGVTTYDLDLIGADGTEYEVTLDADFQVLKVDRDDDGAPVAETPAAETPAAENPAAEAPAAPVDPDDLAGDELARASTAAIAAAGGGTVTDAERSDDAGHAFDVEVRLPDGSEVDVDLDANFGVLAVVAGS
ncbi:PepSY domain-containing protein [Williamsia sp.]|uniref:PepSY domain-containing protein n=1 Tax=Williamsia sp. TaxID=1872085 RepID=UPI002F934428